MHEISVWRGFETLPKTVLHNFIIFRRLGRGIRRKGARRRGVYSWQAGLDPRAAGAVQSNAPEQPTSVLG
ncbi:MAG: hypothetical protein IID05_10700 [Gemmatimonadetes bacterium]|nr:hypothetical protein [Gemmatimonadota bacterium]